MRTSLLLVVLVAIVHAGPTGSPYPTSCGKTPVKPNLSTERTGGVQKAVPHSWPWHVAFCSNGWSGGCSLDYGGSIIHNGWVMLTGDSVYDDMNPKSYQVMAGVDKIDGTLNGEQISKVRSIYIHPKFNAKTNENNVALLELQTPFNYSDHVQPICLPDNDSAASAEPNSAYITAWRAGFDPANDPKQSSMPLHQAKEPFVDNETCQKYFPSGISKDMVCVGGHDLGTWMPEGGSPMVVQGASGTWFEVGISSFVVENGDLGEVVVHSRVSSFCDFIFSSTRGKASCQPFA